jgi:hypothetical protein
MTGIAAVMMDKASWVGGQLLSKAQANGMRPTHINKQVLPQAPSPTMTSFRRISAMMSVAGD